MRAGTVMKWGELFSRRRGIVHWEAPVGQYGLCDRLRGLACGLAWAEGLGRTLHYLWQPNDLCPADFGSLFEEPRFAHIRSGLPPAAAESLCLRIAANPLPHQFWNYLRGEGLPDGGFSSLEQFANSWRDQVERLRPAPAIRKAVARVRKAAGDRPLVGVHLRRTDVLACDSKLEINAGNVDAHDRQLLAQLRQILGERRDVCFFLASDSHDYFARWAAILKDEGMPFVVHEKGWSADFRQTSIADAVVDLWVLGGCSLVLGTVKSGFLVIAKALGAETRLLPVAPVMQ